MGQTRPMTQHEPRVGALVLVGTPIGNVGDLSPRARDALGNADAIACEDTRRTGKLLGLLGIAAPKLIVANDHTETDACAPVVRRVAAGERVALVTDAGMPAISDPGQVVVAAVVAAGLPVEVVPGPSALDTAVALSGIPAGRFCFEGFLPRKGAARGGRLAVLAAESRPTVLYEAPHRLVRTLGDLRDVCGDARGVAVVRELTKLHEEHWRGDLASACAWAADHEPRGEYVIIVSGTPAVRDVADDEIRDALDAIRGDGASTRDAVEAVSMALDVPHRRVYTIALDKPGTSQADR